jgi:hypothetical protein
MGRKNSGDPVRTGTEKGDFDNSPSDMNFCDGISGDFYPSNVSGSNVKCDDIGLSLNPPA